MYSSWLCNMVIIVTVLGDSVIIRELGVYKQIHKYTYLL